MKHLDLVFLPYLFCSIVGALAQPSGTPTPSTPTPGGDITSLIPRSTFDEMLKHKNDKNCYGGFYNYEAFVAAARSFPGFASTGDTDIRKREIAAFFAQTSHETAGGSTSSPDGTYAWGYCYIQERGSPGDYCRPSAQYPCAPNQKYFGRGPFQLKWNDNYGAAGSAIGADLLNNPDLVIGDPTISFKTAIWFWMTPQAPKPSCHAVMTGQWKSQIGDWRASRYAGFGLTTNILNGMVECGNGPNDQGATRIGFYRRYCSLLGVSPGDFVDCYDQRPYYTAVL